MSPRTPRARDLLLVGLAILGLVASLGLLSQLKPNEPPTSELLVPPAFLEPVRRVRALFGKTAEYELVLIDGASPVTDERLAEIEGVVRAVPGVTRTWSAVSRPHLALTGANEGHPPAFLLEPGPPLGRDALAAQPLDRFLRPSPTEAAIWVVLDARVWALSETRRFTHDLRAALERTRRDGETLRDIGTPARRVAELETALRDASRTLPWLLLAVVLVPLAFFRSWVAVFFPLLIAGLTSGTLFAAYRLVYGHLDTTTLVLFPLVWSVATMDALHLYEGSSHGGPRETRDAAVARARVEIALPALVTAGTTALSMLTLAVPGAPPLLRTFGVWGALGTILAYGYTFALGGALLRVFRPRPAPRWPSRFTRIAVAASRRHPGRVLVVWALVSVAGGVGLLRLRVEPSYQHMFARGNPSGDAIRALQGTFDAELVPFEIYLEARTPRQRQPNELLMANVGLAHYLDTLSETRLSLSAALLVSEWVQTDPRAAHALASPRFFDDLRASAGALKDDPAIAEWLELDRGVARTQVLFRPMSYARKAEIIGWITDYVATNTSGYRLTLGGPSYLQHVVEREGLRGIAWGAATDLVLLGFIMVVLLRRARLVWVAFLGNVVPVAVLCGFMGLLGIPWSFDLLGLPVIVLGLAIDDTVHLLWPLRLARGGFGSAFHRSVRKYGVAVMATSVLLSASLAGLSLSGFGVNHELGILLPAGLLLGLAAELTLVPAALSRSRGSRQG